MSKTMKENRITAEAMVANKVTTRAELDEALPVLIELQNQIKWARMTTKECQEVFDTLSTQCAEYALDHEALFGETVVKSAKGVTSGDYAAANGITYHFFSGYDKLKRTEAGEQLSQDFLAKLPLKWLRTKTELDTTVINRLKVSEEDLKEHGLYHPTKYGWAEKELLDLE